MGRFSKLETGAGGNPEKDPDEGPFGLRTRVRPRDDSSTASTDYDQGHYVAEGQKHYFHGEYQKAMRAYSRAMQVDHSAVEPWVGQVLSLIKMKQHREAAMWAIRGTELFPEDARLASLQGLTLALTGARQRAIACSDFAMGRPNGATAFTWAVRGQILAHAENANASFCFEKALEVKDPDDWQTLALMGDFLLDERKWSRGLEYLKMAAQIRPGNPWLWKRIGLANEHLAFIQAALEAYNTALEISPNDKEATESIRRLIAIPLPTRIWRRLTRKG